MNSDSNILDLRRFFHSAKKLWWVYLISSILLIGAAGWYISRGLPLQPIKGQMLIGEESLIDGGASVASAGKGAGGISQMMKTFSVGGFSASAVDNEVIILQSNDVMLRTVKTLGLNRTYIGKTERGKKKLLWQELPVRIEASEEYFDTLSTNFNIIVELLPGGKVNLKAVKGLFKTELAHAENVKLPTAFNTPLGNFQVLRGETFDSSPFKAITVSITGNNPMSIVLGKNLDIDIATKLSDVIDVELEYANPDLGKAIVNGVMAEYNSKRLDRMHETAVSSIKYYDERIAETLQQLETAEKKAADFKRENSLSGVEAEAGIMMGMSTEGKTRIAETQHAINYYTSVLNSLRNDLNSDNLIPQLATVGDSSIVAYNQLILDRRDLKRSATDSNTALVLLNQRIAEMSDLIQTNAQLAIDRAKSQLQLQAGLTGMATNRLKEFPALEMDYTALARDKEFQNSLYMYLVQARENAVLKLYADSDLGYVFQPAYVKKAGLPLKKIAIVVAAFIFALFGSTVLALIHTWRSQKINAPMDVAFLGIEPHTLALKESDDILARMRTLLTADSGQNVIYLADLEGNSAWPSKVIECFSNAGFNLSEFTADSNDALISPALTSSIAEASKSSDYVFVSVPNPEKLFMIINSIDRPEVKLLTIIPTTLKRQAFRSLVRGMNTSKVFALIVK